MPISQSWRPRPRTLDDRDMVFTRKVDSMLEAAKVQPSVEDRKAAWEETVSAISTPGHKPYTINHPSGLVGQHMGTHLSIYARSRPEGPADRLVGRVLFNNAPAKPRTATSGWPDQMDAIDALDDAAKRLPGFNVREP